MGLNTNVQQRTNTTLVMDILEWHLQQIGPNTGCYTGALTVDRRTDVRKIWQDNTLSYRENGSLVRIKQGKQKLLTGKGGLVGSSTRYSREIELYCFQELADEQDRAQITIDQIQDWLLHDIQWQIRDDMLNNFALAKAALQSSTGPWGGPGTWNYRVSCINCHLESVVSLPTAFPKCAQILVYSYLYDEVSPGGSQGMS